jgi:hypothetical protein
MTRLAVASLQIPRRHSVGDAARLLCAKGLDAAAVGSRRTVPPRRLPLAQSAEGDGALTNSNPSGTGGNCRSVAGERPRVSVGGSSGLVFLRHFQTETVAHQQPFCVRLYEQAPRVFHQSRGPVFHVKLISFRCCAFHAEKLAWGTPNGEQAAGQ